MILSKYKILINCSCQQWPTLNQVVQSAIQHMFALTSALPAAAVQISCGQGRARSQCCGCGGGHGSWSQAINGPTSSYPCSSAPAPEPITQPVYPANHNWNLDCCCGTIQGPHQFFFEHQDLGTSHAAATCRARTSRVTVRASGHCKVTPLLHHRHQ